MKKFLALIVLALPMMAFAGPEDHTPGAVYQATSPAPYYLSTLVFDTAHVSADGQNLVLEARYGNFFGEFKIIKTSRHNEDRVNITAQKVILDKWNSGCGDGERAVATIETEENTMGVSARYMTITVEYSVTNDTCHSRPQTQVIKYQLAQ